MATKLLTNNDDNYLGTNLNDDIDALAGNDILDGGAGNDILRGNAGNDLIAGGLGIDTLWGGDGDDVLDGGTGNDKLYGDAGHDIIYGGTGNDSLNGGSGNDYLFGGSGNDTLFGGAGSDVLDGGTGNDRLYDTNNTTAYGSVSTDRDEMIGGAGDDTFYGGYDTMWGNDGNDVFHVNNQGTVYGGQGNDTITVKNTNSTLSSLLDGGAGNDILIGGSGNDVLFSGYGTDSLNGGAGNDSYVLTFDSGVKTITDSAGIDTVFYIRDFKGDGRDDNVGADGKELDPTLTFEDFKVTMQAGIEKGVLDDQIYVNNPNSLTYTIAWLIGNNLNNTLTGSNLNDILDGGAGNDIIRAGDGDDIIFAGQGTDTISGGAGEDIIAAVASYSLTNGLTSTVENIDLLDQAGISTATGNAANNILYGNKFNNILNGGGGDDILDGLFYSTTYAPVPSTDKATGSDKLYGGAGNDLYRIDSNADIVIETNITTGGIDTVEFSGAVKETNYKLTDGVENLVMKANLDNGIGNKLNNIITGNSAINSLIGDYGDDYLDGGAGIDKFDGGYGDDTFVVDHINESITERAGQGEDWVQSAVISLDLNNLNWGGNIENASLTGKANLNLTGNSTNNTLMGNDGNNILDGKGGIDILNGGLGDDIYYIDSTTDTLSDSGGIDTIQSTVSFSLAPLLDFENLSLSPLSAATNATGNIYDNYLKGNEKANTLMGLDGNDILEGGAGADTLIGGKGDDLYKITNDGDVVREIAGEGNDTIEIASTFSLSLASLGNNIENLILSGANIANGTGTNGANKLTGNSAANILMGLDGTDTLIGGEGADTLIGGLGADILILTESAAGKDIVRIGLTDSAASVSNADRIVGFKLLDDTLDLAGTIKIAANTTGFNGTDSGTIKSHAITNGLIRFDDVDTYSSPLSISSTNIQSVITYLSLNITDGSTVAFQGAAPDPNSATSAQVASTWVFQDNGSNDTLVALVGMTTATSLTTGFSSTGIHLA